jgi:hypothetical protein
MAIFTQRPVSSSSLYLTIQYSRPILLLDPVLHSRKLKVKSKLQFGVMLASQLQKILEAVRCRIVSASIQGTKGPLTSLACTISGSPPSYPYSFTNANVSARSISRAASSSKVILLTDALTPLTLPQAFNTSPRHIISRWAKRYLPAGTEVTSACTKGPVSVSVTM